VVAGTDTLSTADLAISNDTVTLTIGDANGDDGYRVSLTPVGGAADAGVGDAGADARGSRDAREVGGGSGGTAGVGGGGGGASAIDADLDAAAGVGGTLVSGGARGSSTGGRATGGTTSAGGETGASGGGGVGGAIADQDAGGVADGAGGTSGASSKANRGSSGCSCAMADRGGAYAVGLWPLVAVLALIGRARRAGKSQSDLSSRESSPLPPAPAIAGLFPVEQGARRVRVSQIGVPRQSPM
jgi:MYXO-CTERM domain-containing protein